MEKQPYHNAKDILHRYINDTCSDEEKAWVESWYLENHDPEFQIDTELAEEHLVDVWQSLNDETRDKTYPLRKVITAAAAVIIIVGTGLWYLSRSSVSLPENNIAHTEDHQHEIKAGRDQALLTLADGRIIHLDSIAIGTTVNENGMIITKMDDGTLTYHLDNAIDIATNAYNTISTPRGGQYKVVLPDQSIVWLNAASSLHFPMAFTGSTRSVTLDGEGYFEIAHHKDKPFIVTSKNQQTVVKGTKFNITAYSDDEAIVTTLIEGSVLVQASHNDYYNGGILLRPSEQTSLNSNNTFRKTKVQALEAIAWKNGKFIFNNTALESIMKQLGRWYDVEIVYLDKVENITFTGSVSRFDDIHDVLRKISLTESVHFETRERRIMVRR